MKSKNKPILKSSHQNTLDQPLWKPLFQLLQGWRRMLLCPLLIHESEILDKHGCFWNQKNR